MMAFIPGDMVALPPNNAIGIVIASIQNASVTTVTVFWSDIMKIANHSNWSLRICRIPRPNESDNGEAAILAWQRAKTQT